MFDFANVLLAIICSGPLIVFVVLLVVFGVRSLLGSGKQKEGNGQPVRVNKGLGKGCLLALLPAGLALIGGVVGYIFAYALVIPQIFILQCNNSSYNNFACQQVTRQSTAAVLIGAVLLGILGFVVALIIYVIMDQRKKTDPA
jgi:hypothetical protein